MNSRGDTIVEVLLAIAIVSVVLGGAFVSANRSLRGTQVSKERLEAVNVSKGQAEILMAWLSDDEKEPQVRGESNFCFSVDNVAKTISKQTGSCPYGPDDRYNSIITSSDNEYKITTQWEKIGDGEAESVEIIYRAEAS